MRKVLVVQRLRPEAMALLDARPDIAYEVLTDTSPENLLRHAAETEALTIRDAILPPEIVEAAPGLRVVSRHGVGYDNIPLDLCTRRGIPVTVVGDVNAVSVAEHTFYLILAAARHGSLLDRATRSGDFAMRVRVVGTELRGSTLLIVGYGRIGREVAARARAFGMAILVHDPYADAAAHPDVRFAPNLHEALAEAQVVSLHLPLTEATRNLIGVPELARMRRGAILVNAARGGIIDEVALVAALDSGHLGGAALDTFAVEPLPANHPLCGRDDVVLSPHSAALTEQCLVAMGLATVRNALAGLDGALDPALVVNRVVLRENRR